MKCWQRTNGLWNTGHYSMYNIYHHLENMCVLLTILYFMDESTAATLYTMRPFRKIAIANSLLCVRLRSTKFMHAIYFIYIFTLCNLISRKLWWMTCSNTKSFGVRINSPLFTIEFYPCAKRIYGNETNEWVVNRLTSDKMTVSNSD